MNENNFKRVYNNIATMILRFYGIYYARSKIKIAWCFLLPLMISIAISLIFKNVFNLKNEFASLIIISGYLFWQSFSQSFTRGLTLFTDERSFYKNLSFNRIYFLPSYVLFHFLISFPGMFFLGIYCYISINFSFINAFLFFYTIIMLYFFTLGFLFIFASWNVFYPDIKHVIETSLIFILWLSPVFYETKDLPDKLKWLYFINPLAFGISCFRSSLSISEHSLYSLIGFTCCSVVLFFFGFFYYLKHQKEIIKYI